MSRAMLADRAARLSDASACAAIQAATLARLGFPDSRLESRAERLDAMAANYRRAAKSAH